MKITELIRNEKLSISFEVFPPKTDTAFESVKAATEEIAELHPAFMSVTYGAGGGTSKYTLDIAKDIKERFGVKALRHSDIVRAEVSRVAICTGAGASLIDDARRARVDIYLTADLKYNDFMRHENAVILADMGHFESEYCAIQILFDILSKILPIFAVRKSVRSRNPVNYMTAGCPNEV